MSETPRKTDSMTRIKNGIISIKKTVWDDRSLSDRPDSLLAFFVGSEVNNFQNRIVQTGGGREILLTIYDAFPYNGMRTYRPRELLFHGSPVPPDELNGYIEPKKATWRNRYGRFDDGKVPAVAISETPDVPILHALLNRNNPSIAAIADEDLFLLSYRSDIRGRNMYITSEAAIEAIQDSTGYVYFFTPPPDTRRYIGAGGLRDEYRTEEKIKIEDKAYVAVHVDDLPPDLIILGVGRVEGEKLLDEIGIIDPETFLTKLDEAGVSIRTHSGIFPHEFFQGYRKMK